MMRGRGRTGCCDFVASATGRHAILGCRFGLLGLKPVNFGFQVLYFLLHFPRGLAFERAFPGPDYRFQVLNILRFFGHGFLFGQCLDEQVPGSAAQNSGPRGP